MKQRTLTILLLSLSALLFSGAASAQTARGPFGAGAEVTTTGLVGAMFVFDPGPFHLDALLNANFAHNNQRIAVAGRFFFPLHRSERADFSVGPGIGIVHSNLGPAGAPRTTPTEPRPSFISKARCRFARSSSPMSPSRPRPGSALSSRAARTTTALPSAAKPAAHSASLTSFEQRGLRARDAPIPPQLAVGALARR